MEHPSFLFSYGNFFNVPIFKFCSVLFIDTRHFPTMINPFLTIGIVHLYHWISLFVVEVFLASISTFTVLHKNSRKYM